MLPGFYAIYIPGVLVLLVLLIGIPYYRARRRERNPQIPDPRERDETQAYREARARADQDVPADQPPPSARPSSGAAARPASKRSR